MAKVAIGSASLAYRKGFTCHGGQGRMNPPEHCQALVVSNCGITEILQAIVHDGCPSQLASKLLTGGGGRGNINVNIFVNIRTIVNIEVSWDCYLA